MKAGDRITVVHRVSGTGQLATAFGVLDGPGVHAFIRQATVNAVTADVLYTTEGVFTIDLEGYSWAKGWEGPEVNALQAAAVLGT